MNFDISDIVDITGGRLLNKKVRKEHITQVYFDTRRINYTANRMFAAISNEQADGHQYIGDAYNKGIRHFLISKRNLDPEDYPGANFIYTDDTIAALHKLAGNHRSRFNIPVVGITGSNGKTIVKEWLAACLSDQYRLSKNPLSYNSQLGVPISVLGLEPFDEIGIFEAGISKRGEMEKLAAIIEPSIGIFTNLGDAHSAGFSSDLDKLDEKLLLFRNSHTIIYNKDQKKTDEAIRLKFNDRKLVSWGKHPESEIRIVKMSVEDDRTTLRLAHSNKEITIVLPFRMAILVENAMQVIAFLINDGWSEHEIRDVVASLSSLPHRLQIKEGRKGNLIINDSYSLDLASLQVAFDFQEQFSKKLKKVLFISRFEQQSEPDKLKEVILPLLDHHNVRECICIGWPPGSFSEAAITLSYFDNTIQCLNEYDFERLENSSVLIKGARRFGLESIFEKLSPQVHETVLETDFGAIAHNIRVYRSFLLKDTRLMMVLKAEAYGTGSIRLAHFLESRHADYLAVAILDEAIRIRQSGCDLNIMVLNVQDSDPALLVDYRLEPEVYSLEQLDGLIAFCHDRNEKISIHIKLETGMHRLGFGKEELDILAQKVLESGQIKVKSIMSHLAASDDPVHDAFTDEQATRFEKMYAYLSSKLSYRPLRHLLNTSGIIRHSRYQYDMVRIGLGIYGIDETDTIADRLEPAHKLSARVLQVKRLKQGKSTGYQRKGIAERETRIAVISIGYADGLMRRAGNGRFSVRIHNKFYPVIGNICMDVTMVDVGLDSDVKPGDEVVIFDKDYSIKNLAAACDTITYEIISRIAPRVKRLYIHQ